VWVPHVSDGVEETAGLEGIWGSRRIRPRTKGSFHVLDPAWREEVDCHVG
jgi:hypothetical protein